MKAFRYGPGATGALFCAGPIFTVIMIFGSAILHSTEGGFWLSLAVVIPLILVAIPFGAILGAVPVLLGGYMMGSLGVEQPASRHPLLWALAGAVMALPMLILLGGPPTWDTTGLFTVTGAICALIVRYGTRWSDDNV